MAAKQAPN